MGIDTKIRYRYFSIPGIENHLWYRYFSIPGIKNQLWYRYFSIPGIEIELGYRYFSIPGIEIYSKHRYLFRYQSIDTSIDTKYRYLRYLTPLYPILMTLGDCHILKTCHIIYSWSGFFWNPSLGWLLLKTTIAFMESCVQSDCSWKKNLWSTVLRQSVILNTTLASVRSCERELHVQFVYNSRYVIVSGDKERIHKSGYHKPGVTWASQFVPKL